jgi:hypothetical protein
MDSFVRQGRMLLHIAIIAVITVAAIGAGTAFGQQQAEQAPAGGVPAVPESGAHISGNPAAVGAPATVAADTVTVVGGQSAVVAADTAATAVGAPVTVAADTATAGSKPATDSTRARLADKGAKKGKRPDGLFGAGAHWGADFSMSMDDGGDALPRGKSGVFRLNHFVAFNTAIDNLEKNFNNLIKGGIQNIIANNNDNPPELVDSIVGSFINSISDSIGPGFSFNYADSTVIASDNIKIIRAPFLKTSRTEFKRSALNFGGKLFVNVIPVIETIELSFNIGVWQYMGEVSYLDVKGIRDSVVKNLTLPAPGNYPYSVMPLTLKEYGISFLGLEETPYAKLQLDATLRKTVLRLWRVRVGAGAGMSVHFATPILSTGLIEDVKKKKNIKTDEELVENFIDKDKSEKMGKAIVDEILDKLFTPRYGAHIAAGAHLKFPLMGVYVDGKLMIPISDFDDDGQVKGLGFLVNMGLALSF